MIRRSPTALTNSEKLVAHARITGIDPALIIAAPHYGLRYGLAPATGNFQRLRGRPPLVSPLKSCMGRSFTAVTRVQIPSGTDPHSGRASRLQADRQLRALLGLCLEGANHLDDNERTSVSSGLCRVKAHPKLWSINSPRIVSEPY